MRKKQYLVIMCIFIMGIISGCLNANEGEVTQEKEGSETLISNSEIEGIKAETQSYPDLETLIIEYYEIPDEYLDTTSYYYNFVDLNEDGKNEIFVVISGPYTSGTGGSSALWIDENDGKLNVKQRFTLMHTPIIISDKMTNGFHDLIVLLAGGGVESQYKILTYSNGCYTNINDAKGIDTLEGITGKAILANDFMNEMLKGIEGLKLKHKK